MNLKSALAVATAVLALGAAGGITAGLRGGDTPAPASGRGDVVVDTDPARHDVLRGDSSTAPGAHAPDPIGGIDVSGLVPAGLDLTALPGAPATPTPLTGGNGSLSAGATCAYQCISSGVAYPAASRSSSSSPPG